MSSRVCLLSMVDDNHFTLLDLYASYANNILLVSGGLMEQPSFYIEAMRFIGAHFNVE